MKRGWLQVLALSFAVTTLAVGTPADVARAQGAETVPPAATEAAAAPAAPPDAAAPASPAPTADPVEASPPAEASSSSSSASSSSSSSSSSSASSSSSSAPACAASAAVCLKNEHFALWPRVRIRTGFDVVQADPEILYVGQNDGFFADQLRLGVDGAFHQDVRFRFILDAASVVPGNGVNQPVTSVLAAARDVWVAWAPSPWFAVSAGQQFMPTDTEGTTTSAALPFVRRSVATVGVRAGHGNAVSGLSPTRQLGLVIGTGGPGGGPNPQLGPVSLEYKLAVSNGNGQNVLGNDNKLPAFYGRFGVGYEDIVSLGAGGRFNPRTVGTLPNLYTETDALGFADLTVRLFGIEVVGQGIYRATSLDTLFPGPDGAGQESGLGATGWVWLKKPFGVDLFGVQPAYRVSWFDPSSAFATDELLENSLGVRWDVPMDVLRLSLFADYTLLTEIGEAARDLQNDRFTALVQLEL